MDTTTELTEPLRDSLLPTPLSTFKTAPKTLVDLLRYLEPKGLRNFSALKSKATVLSAYLRKPADLITLDDIDLAKPNLRSFLTSRKLAENSIRAYISEVGTLLKHAKAMGWVPGADVPTAWLTALGRSVEAKCDVVCRAMSRKRKSPKQVTQEDIDAWVVEQVQHGQPWKTARRRANSFMKVMALCGAVQELPPLLKDDFGVRLEDFPSGLRKEVEEALRWKTANFSSGRPGHGKIRELSAANLRASFCQLYGFATSILGVPEIAKITELVTPEIVQPFVEWLLNQRKVRGQTVRLRLVVVIALLKQHPMYRNVDIGWLKELADSVQTDSQTELREKQAAKQVPYEVVETIPRLLHAERRAEARRSQKALALTIRNELLMRWLTVLPWRQRNIRECRIAGPTPNLFKAKINPFLPVAKPAWVEEALRNDPECEFWQFKFRPDETKVGNGVHTLVPRPLVPLLEEYLSVHRPQLLQGRDSEQLFLGETGSMLCRVSMAELVGQLTVRFIGKRITPHTFRHIVAYAWLRDHPEDFLTLSKILWHTNINTTLKIYGASYNESNGTCGMESWVEARKK